MSLAPSGITADGLTSLVKLLSPLVKIVEGQATIIDDEAAANAVLDFVSLFVPGSALPIKLVETAEPALNLILAELRRRGMHVEPGESSLAFENDINFKNR